MRNFSRLVLIALFGSPMAFASTSTTCNQGVVCNNNPIYCSASEIDGPGISCGIRRNYRFCRSADKAGTPKTTYICCNLEGDGISFTDAAFSSTEKTCRSN